MKTKLALSLTALGSVASFAALGCGTSDDARSADDEAKPSDAGADVAPSSCGDYREAKNVYFGDLHVHTAFSLDSYSNANRNQPDDAYAFAKGERALPIAAGIGADLTAKIDRPLDFVAVTDHSEFLSIAGECQLGVGARPRACDDLANQGSTAQQTVSLGGLAELASTHPRQPAQCQGSEQASADCKLAARTAWGKERAAAAAANDPCHFTSLVGFEWTSQTAGANLHRNVIFASEQVPDVPEDYLSHPTALSLWRALEAECVASEGCRALTIPHNSNYSLGTMWDTVGDPAALPYMQRYQTLAEVMQHKGASECLPEGDLGEASCWFERSTGNMIAVSPTAPDVPAPESAPGYVRNGLAKGLELLASTGVDPLELGFVASTDTHDATAGNVSESSWPGHIGSPDYTPARRLSNGFRNNPGGLTGVWAPANTRGEIFAALERREVFATSGPRIAVRYYALDAALSQAEADALCAEASFPEGLLARGATPMGARVTGAKAPWLFVAAMQDAVPLTSIDVVKLAVDASGKAALAITKLAAPGGSAAHVCLAHRDAAFDPRRPSAYYARVYEQPTPRWSHYDCAAAPGANPSCTPEGGLDVDVEERAWTSPIFFRP